MKNRKPKKDRKKYLIELNVHDKKGKKIDLNDLPKEQRKLLADGFDLLIRKSERYKRFLESMRKRYKILSPETMTVFFSIIRGSVKIPKTNYLSEVVKDLKLAIPTVDSHIKKLEKLGMIAKKPFAGAKLFVINWELLNHLTFLGLCFSEADERFVLNIQAKNIFSKLKIKDNRIFQELTKKFWINFSFYVGLGQLKSAEVLNKELNNEDITKEEKKVSSSFINMLYLFKQAFNYNIKKWIINYSKINTKEAKEFVIFLKDYQKILAEEDDNFYHNVFQKDYADVYKKIQEKKKEDF